jgi:hypothetical protein
VIDATSNATSAIALGDIDNDGDLDVVVANHDAVPNKVYYNSGHADRPFEGAAVVELGESTGVTGTTTIALTLANIDGDPTSIWSQRTTAGVASTSFTKQLKCGSPGSRWPIWKFPTARATA